MAGTDFAFNDEIVVVDKIKDVGFCHDSMTLTLTDTMKQGSIVDSAGVEVATADAANAFGVIDDLQFSRHRDDMSTGDTVLATVAVRGCIFNEAAISYTDGDIDTAGKAALSGMNKFTTVADDSDII